MHRFIPPIALAVMTAGFAVTNPVAAQEYPRYAPRCTTEALNPGIEPREFCERPFAAFGLSGPTMTPHQEFDVIATGSIKTARDRIHDHQKISD